MSEIFKPTLPEPKWARIISSAPEMLTSFLLTVGGAFLGAAIGAEGFWGNPWYWCAFVLFLVGGLLSWARRGRKKNLETTHARQRENELSKLDNSYRLTIQEMAQNAFMVAAALRSLNKPDLEKSLPETRKLILQIIQHRLGPPAGTRVCLFVVDPEASAAGEPDRIIASGLGENGRATTPSIRVFTEDDETFQLSVMKLERYEANTSKLEEAKHRVPPFDYETFATYPVSTDTKLFGILTIDAPKTGDINRRDRALLSFYAGLMTITFVVEKNAPSILRSKYDGMWHNRNKSKDEKEAQHGSTSGNH